MLPGDRTCRRFLVADDNSNIQKMVILAFKGEGIDVVAVGNGDAAVKKAIEIVPDLVLADIFMPVRSGYEVCEFLKQDSRFSHIPVVLLAGAFDPFDEKEAQRVGADGVLKKPFVPPDPLVSLVKGLLEKNAERLVAVSAPAQTTAVSAQSSSPTPKLPQAPRQLLHLQLLFLRRLCHLRRMKGRQKMNTRTMMPKQQLRFRRCAILLFQLLRTESEHHGGADAFGSLMETSALETELAADARA